VTGGALGAHVVPGVKTSGRMVAGGPPLRIGERAAFEPGARLGTGVMRRRERVELAAGSCRYRSKNDTCWNRRPARICSTRVSDSDPIRSPKWTLSTEETCDTTTTLCLGRFPSPTSSRTFPGAGLGSRSSSSSPRAAARRSASSKNPSASRRRIRFRRPSRRAPRASRVTTASRPRCRRSARRAVARRARRGHRCRRLHRRA
jgi:hypothetical protein